MTTSSLLLHSQLLRLLHPQHPRLSLAFWALLFFVGALQAIQTFFAPMRPLSTTLLAWPPRCTRDLGWLF